eukprot:Hpha_TRINITY_DN15528_c0_g1::TRINITY_DN15528_c0_g1_i1::g.104777::m.104777
MVHRGSGLVEEDGSLADDLVDFGATTTTVGSAEFGANANGGYETHRTHGSTRGGNNENFKVVIRVRPPLPRELEGFVNIVKVPPEPTAPRGITITEHLETDEGCGGVYSSQSYTFDRVYDQHATQETVYEHSAHPAVEAVLRGYNATMIAYGQTGTGKTFTMEGTSRELGIIPRATEDIFNFIRDSDENSKFLVRASYLQIYNEAISDLIRSERRNLSVRESKGRGVYVENLSEWVVRSPQEVYGLMEQGSRVRVTGNTKMSELSSRSHAIFRIICEMKTDTYDEEGGESMQSFRIGKLNIVDLAGSEKIRQTGATGTRLEESKYINRSLSQLGNVISALTAPGGSRSHVPYRDSKLTRILEDSLGGNCKTTMIATVSPAFESYLETLSTLKYANRAKNIKNEATVNEDLDQRALIRKYERELRELRAELSAVNRNYAPKVKLAESEQRRQEALLALKARSVEVIQEKRAKEQLVEQIAGMEKNGHVSVVGEENEEGSVAFREAIHRVSEEYMNRLDELDKERQVIEEDKAQVDRYKQLLLKQRDIMIQLTARLNERDGTILTLQEELDAYDEQQRLMEEALDLKTEQLARTQTSSSTDLQRQELEESESQRRAAQSEVDRLQLELYFLRRNGAGGGSPPEPDLLRRFQRQDEEHKAARADMARQLEERTAECQRLKEQLASGGGGGGGAEVAQLKRSLATEAKERRALKTILETKIKTKVDNLAALVRLPDQRQRVDTDFAQLQNLVNATIQAI